MVAWIGVIGAVCSAVIAGTFTLLNDEEPAKPAGAIGGDDMRTIADPTLPDGSKLAAGTKASKVWLVKNIGNAPWRGRYVERVGDDPCVTSERRVAIPDADPSDTIAVTVPITVNGHPGDRCVAGWLMVDHQGQPLFPRKIGQPPRNGNMWLDIEVISTKP
ncbi:NBR1-Ig-like domain-containing protein [Nonomuraea sp. PA05]|uniref:NBR1-Ig-like domain-containing protein n=1 Tax=Nonomuraea sp. PA05 TaxID=2604466 RepID=UPI001651B9ED|nr:NBR1-Ig-like domain-containing protein [Nonomuraea sp. PA05]